MTENDTPHQDRQPSPDPAEDNAFFPSPYSLTQYTSTKTDFDAVTTEGRKYTGGRWKVLVIATQERYMLMRNNTMFSTGNHPVETLLPLHHMSKAGFGIDVATLTAAPAKLEWWAYPSQDDAVGETWNQLSGQVKQPKGLARVVEEELGPDSDYLAVFVPGGHGAMLGIPQSRAVGQVLDWAFTHDRLIISLCHGPAAFLAASTGSKTPLGGYRICAFPDSIDWGANVDIGYLPGQMPWALCQALIKQGMEIVNEGMTGATTTDRNVLTGDSPLAAHQLGKDSAEALLRKASTLS